MIIGGTASHVSKEVFILMPTFAHRDAALTVTVEVGRGRTATSAEHGSPYAMFRGFVSGRFAVGAIWSSSSQMAARLRVASAKFVSAYCCRCAAIAMTQPMEVAVARLFNWLERNQLAKTLTGYVYHGPGHRSLRERLPVKWRLAFQASAAAPL